MIDFHTYYFTLVPASNVGDVVIGESGVQARSSKDELIGKAGRRAREKPEEGY